jgi:hexosaminidase
MAKILSLVFISTILLLIGCKESTNTVIKKALTTPKQQSAKTRLKKAPPADIDSIAKTLQVKYQLLTNIPNDKCDKKQANGACFAVQLNFTAAEKISVKNWQITFSQISPIQSFTSKEFSVKHLNGDLHQISLNNNFSGFSAGETKTLIFRANFWMLAETDALPNYIVSTTEGNVAKVINSTKVVIDKDTGLETLPFVESFTDINRQFKRSANDKTQWLNSAILYQRNQKSVGNTKLNVSQQIIPTPKQITIDPQNRQLDLRSGIKVNYTNVEPKSVKAAFSHLARLGLTQNKSGIAVNLSIKSDDKQVSGAYKLSVAKNSIDIIGVDSAGVFYGLSSLSSLLTLGNSKVPWLTIDDQPHYQFRGMMIDVARNFHSKAFILKLLAQMSAYKLNKLHLHLGDDEGWRIAIPGLPELTDIGAKRCLEPKEDHCLLPQLGAGIDENSKVNGYYTVADYQEILRAANARHIQVIPSFDMPGHSRAAVKAMAARYKKYIIAEQYDKAVEYLLHDSKDTTQYSSVQYYNDNTLNVCMNSTYHFIEKVLTEVKKIHDAAGQPLTRYHIGADETAGAWVNSPACESLLSDKSNGIDNANQLSAYFIERVATMLSTLNIETAGWSDGLSHTSKANMPAVVQANAWDVLSWGGHSKVHELANRNWQVVISSPDVTYFDFPYEADPKEFGYYWASRHTNTEKIFQFMPDNLPVHAEFWLDREDKAYQADDSKRYDTSGKLVSAPLNNGVKFLGIQGQLWSENTRSDTMAEYKIFPRLLALAERGWHLANWAVPYNYQGGIYDQNSAVFTAKRQEQRDQQWRLFANTIGKKELAKLEQANINYRLPTVGAIINNGVLYANSAFPGIAIEYQDKTQTWQPYTNPITVNGAIKVRTRSFDGLRTGRATNVITVTH